LTLCLQGEGVYSLVDGERKDWRQHAVMVTPPGAPHSHHNEGDARMESYVIQDGGLHYYTRTTGFAFVD
jgi:gentisate 1,2-dioxygenase